MPGNNISPPCEMLSFVKNLFVSFSGYFFAIKPIFMSSIIGSDFK